MVEIRKKWQSCGVVLIQFFRIFYDFITFNLIELRVKIVQKLTKKLGKNCKNLLSNLLSSGMIFSEFPEFFPN